MSDQLHLYVCEHFKADTEAVLTSGNFSDVVCTYFPSRCGRPLPVNKQLSSLSLFSKTEEDDDKLFCACSCLATTDKAYLNNKNIKQLHLNNCFQMFAPKAFISSLINDRAYIITPHWLAKWKVWVKQWGDKESVRLMFSETVTKLVLLDTGVDSQCNANLKELSTYLDCPSETISVGLDYYYYFLENEILKWRLEKQSKQDATIDSTPKKIESDYALALDLMSSLPRAEKEDEVAHRIMDIFVMMFAARKVSYLSVRDSKPLKLWSIPAGIENKVTKERLSKCQKLKHVSESGKGFCLPIRKDDEIVAVIEIDELTFPENLLKYQNLALTMTGVLALYIENSRHFQNIIDINDSLKTLNNTKDKLFSIIGHDLRNPLSNVLGYSNLLIEKRGSLDIEESKRYLDIINLSAKNTFVLLDNLLNWAQTQTEQIKVYSKKIVLSSLIREVIDISNSSAKTKNITLNLIQSDEIVVDSDENMVKTVLRNLISNAIKFTKSGGEINVFTILKQNHIEIIVSDNGVGMNEETCKKLFDINTNITVPGTENEKGSGLGLVLCKEFTEKLGGNIWVESELNKGSDFRFTLPFNK